MSSSSPIDSPIIRYAHRLRIATLILAALLVFATVAAVVPLSGDGIIEASIGVDGIDRSWAVATVIIVLWLVVAALVSLSMMLRAIERGALFDREVTQGFRRFAGFLMAAAIANIGFPMLAMIASALAASDRQLRLTAEGSDLIMLLVGVILLFVARLFEIAARYEEDSKTII